MLHACLRPPKWNAAPNQWGYHVPGCSPSPSWPRLVWPHGVPQDGGNLSNCWEPAASWPFARRGRFRDSAGASREHYLATDTTTAREPGACFTWRGMSRAAPLRSRQVLYERMFGGKRVAQCHNVVSHTYIRNPFGQRVRAFLHSRRTIRGARNRSAPTGRRSAAGLTVEGSTTSTRPQEA